MESFQGYCAIACDHGPEPFVTNLPRMARLNQKFRTAFWTGQQMQMTLMCLPPCCDIGAEMHPGTDQLLRVEEGQALLRMGESRECMESQYRLGVGDVVFVPCGTWHNITNNGSCPLKLSSLYAPPQHPAGTVHETREQAEH